MNDTESFEDQLPTVPLRRSSTAEQIADALRETILAGRVRADAPLREASLATAFGVSRNTIREAIQILAQQGLVTRQLHRGAHVPRIDPDGVRDLFAVRRLIELSALERAPAPSALEPLDGALRRLESAVETGNDAEIAEADLGFHRAIASLNDSTRLSALYERVEGETRLAVAIIGHAHPDRRRLVEQHRTVLELLREGDAARASTVLEDHLREAEVLLVDRLGEDEMANRESPVATLVE